MARQNASNRNDNEMHFQLYRGLTEPDVTAFARVKMAELVTSSLVAVIVRKVSLGNIAKMAVHLVHL